MADQENLTYWKKQDFKALQKTWYQRLEEAGFRDIECIVEGKYVLKANSFHIHKGEDPLILENKRIYFILISQRFEGESFGSEVDRLILFMYSNGKRIKEICEALARKGESRCRRTVRVIIRRYEMKWGLRKYSRKELNNYHQHKKTQASPY